ncbi:MAG TPA: type II toxin-antitoxin system HigB family toxin [Polyangia bacterium]|nr:type II toxin-antitoxin system HigB family toxin [Polyangia bacterium]
MRVLSLRTLIAFWTRHADAEQALRAWYKEADGADWRGPADIKRRYATASFVGGDRVVFNIKGNTYRLVVAVDYVRHTAFVKFVGTHAEYDKIDVAKVEP